MDKYEFNLKLEQIKKLAAKKDFKAAAHITNAMDWRKVKDWATLATVINVQESAGYFEEARDTAILAYNRNLGGRRLVYKLTELFIKVKQYDDAQDLFREYCKVAPHDVNRFILEYKLNKAKKASIGTLIGILEAYKEQELDEKYLFELAQLYSRAGEKEKCVKACDEIVLWFSDGEYVDNAIKLKKQYANITATQQKIYEQAVKKKTMSDSEKTKEIRFAVAQVTARLKEDEIEEALRESERTGEEQEQMAAPLVFDIPAAPDNDEDSGLAVDLVQNIPDMNAAKLYEALLKNDAIKVTGDLSLGAPEQTTDLSEAADKVQQLEQSEDAADAAAAQQEEVPEAEEETNSIELAKNKLNAQLQKARQNLANNYEQVRREDEEDRITKAAQSIEVPVNDYNIYDTQNIQQEIARNLDELMQQETEADLFKPDRIQTEKAEEPAAPVKRAEMVVPGAVSAAKESADEAEDDEQIEGQLSIADWFAAVQEEKYGKRETKEFSKAELERELAARESKEEAYDRLMEKQKEEAHKKGEPFNEAEARRFAEAQVFLQSIKTDLAIRTGKATAKLESSVIKEKEDAKLWLFRYKNNQAENEAMHSMNQVLEAAAAFDQNDDTEEAVRKAEAEEAAILAMAGLAATQDIDDSLEDEEDFEEAEDEVEDGEYDSSDEFEDSDEEYEDSDEEEEEEPDDDDEEDDEEETPRRRLFHFGRKRHEEDDEDDEDEEEYEEDDEEEEDEDEDEYEEEEHAKLPRDIRKFFRKYIDLADFETQLVDYFQSAEKEIRNPASNTGNLIISGNRSSDKTSLAKNIVRAMNQMYPEHPRKIAKTTGESINLRGIARAAAKLQETVLIVEDAGAIEPKRVTELLTVIENDKNGMMVILTDSDTEINILLSVNPDLTRDFNHRVVIKQYTVNELVEMAKKYASKRQHAIDDDALLVLYLMIDKLNKANDSVSLDEVKEMIDKAIVRAERRASKKLFGIRKRRGGEYFVLTGLDFKE